MDISGRKKFDNNAIIIVSDMLLTGYDAPILSTLYLDKPLKEHNLLQGIARVNRTRTGKNAGLIVDYCGITEHLVEALAIFSGDLEPGEVMQNIKEEKSRLDLRHSQLVAFFNHIKIDRYNEKQAYIDRAVQYLEPEDLRDEFKELYKKFNKSMDVVLPDAHALQYEYDVKLYNSIRAEARNAYIDDTLKISSDDSRKLQALINEHLRATGIKSLLEEPISVIDREAFEDEIRNTFSDKSKELKMTHRLKHTIKVELDKNPEFYKPLAERLEELIEERRNDRITQLDFLKELEAIQDKIINKSKEAESLGFETEQEFAVFKTLESSIEGDAKIITNVLFSALSSELNIVDWQHKDGIQKEMRKKIKETIRGKIDASKLNSLAIAIVDQLKRN
jgi:type I restriction enzyme R subunit